MCEGINYLLPNAIQDFEKEIFIPAGDITLDGAKALQYLDFSSGDERDNEEIFKSQRYIEELIKIHGEKTELFSNIDYARQMYTCFYSDLDFDAFQSLTGLFSTIDSATIVKQRVLGTLRTVDNQKLLFPHFDGNILKQMVGQLSDNLAQALVGDELEKVISIKVLNGTAQRKLAEKTAEVFESFGYSIFGFDNADSDEYEKTLVIDKTGRVELATEIAEIIRCENIETEIEVDGPDIIVILGKDFNGRYVN